MTDNEYWSTDTEIFDLKEQRWIRGPNLPLGIRDASCVALPPTLDFACLLIGGLTQKDGYDFYSVDIGENVYGLKKSLDEWTLLGKIREGKYSHIALPLT